MSSNSKSLCTYSFCGRSDQCLHRTLWRLRLQVAWGTSDKQLLKFSTVRLKISTWIHLQELLLRSKRILSNLIRSHGVIWGILLFPIVVFQNISLANSNACKCNDSSNPLVFLVPPALVYAHASFLAMFRRRWGNHMVGSCKVKK